MRRIALMCCVAVLGALGVACIPATPAPSAYLPPVVQGIAQSPDPAGPGDTVTVSVDVLDDEVISDVDVFAVRAPSGATLPGVPPCTADLVPGAEPGRATVELACAVPTYASSGTWTIDVRILDRPEPGPTDPLYSYEGLRTLVPFRVAGGTDDTAPPRLLGWSTDPGVVRHDAPFALTLRLEDQAPLQLSPNPYGYYDFVKPFATNSRFACGQPSLVVVSPTVSEITVTCTPSNYGVTGTAELGPHRAIVPVGDALGHEGTVEIWVEAT